MRTLLALVTLSAFASGCAVLKKHDSGRRGDRVFELSVDEQKAFEAWKAALVKACDTANAFEGTAPGTDAGIDARRFLEHSGGSFALHDDGGHFALFGAPLSQLGQSTSTINHEVKVNGKDAEKFGARMTREGSRCKVEVNGESVYETDVWAGLPVLIYGAGDFAPPVESAQVFQTLARSIRRHGLIESAIVAGQQRDPARAWLASTFVGLDAAAVDRLFPAGSFDDSEHNATFLGQTFAPVISRQWPQIDGGDGLMAALTANEGAVALDLAIKPSKYAADFARNDADKGPWHVHAAVSWTAPGSADRLYKVTSLAWSDPTAFDDARYAACAKDRNDLFANTEAFGTGAFAPSFAGVFGPCAAFAESPAAALDADDVARGLVTRKFLAVTGAPGKGYGGWDEGVRMLAKLYLAHQQHPAARLDPAGASPLITALDHAGVAVNTAAAAHPELLDLTDILLDRLAFAWAFNGDVVDDALIQVYVDALANARPVLQRSADTWLDDLSQRPNEQQDRAAYAKSLTDGDKAQLTALLAKAKALDLVSVVEDAKLARLIQERTPLDRVPAWIAALDDLAAFKARDEAKAGEMKFTFKGDFDELAKRAITEEWTGADFVRLEAMAAVAARDLSCHQYTAATSLARCVSGDPFSKQAKALLAPEFGDRYAALAGDFVKGIDGLPEFEFTSTRGDLARLFFAPVWKACDDATFQAHRASLNQLVKALAASQYPARFDTERAVGDLLDQCRN